MNTPTKKIRLTRPWSGHRAGEVIEEWEVTVASMIRKGYGTEYHKPKPAPAAEPLHPEKPGSPPIEAAMLTPAAETATAPPQAGKARGGRSKAGSQE